MSYWSDLERHRWDEIWMNHPLVRARINRIVTGDPMRWPIQFLPTTVPDRIPFRRAVSVGCGIGNLERSLIDLGIAESVTGIDASPDAIAEARRLAGEEGLASRITYEVADARDFLARARDLDAVLFHSSLHHFDRLDELLVLVHGALVRGGKRGILFLEEYVGPSRFEWTWRHFVRYNAIYRSLPHRVRRTRVIRHPVNREDPTEAIESSRIPGVVEKHFRVLRRRDYGGNLLAVLYPNLLRPDQPGGASPVLFDSVIQRLVEREDAILRREPSFYVALVAEPR